MAEKREKLVINIDTSPEAIEAAAAKNIADTPIKAMDDTNHGVKALRSLNLTGAAKFQELPNDITVTEFRNYLDNTVKKLSDAIRRIDFISITDSLSKCFEDALSIIQAIYEPYYSILAEKYPEDTPETLRELCIDFNNSIIEKYGINKDYWPGYPLEDITPEEQAALPAFTRETIKDLLDYAADHIESIRDSHSGNNQDENIVQKQLFNLYDFIKPTVQNPYCTFPNSRVYRKLSEIQKESAGGYLVPVSVDREKKITVNVRVSAIDGKDIDYFTNSFDRNVMATVGNLYEAGNREVTAQSIYNAMTVKKSGNRCSQVMKERIEESLDKGVMTRVFIDYSNQSNWVKDHGKSNSGYIIDDLFIPARRETKFFVDPKNKKKHLIKKYVIYDLPPLYSYSKEIGHLLSLNKKYLTGIGNSIVFNESRFNIRFFLETEILYRSYDPKEREKMAFTFKEICERTDNMDCIPNDTDTPAAKRNKRKKLTAIRKFVFDLLDFYTAKHRGACNQPLINGYEIVTEGKTATGFKIKTNPAVTNEITKNKNNRKKLAKTV